PGSSVRERAGVKFVDHLAGRLDAFRRMLPAESRVIDDLGRTERPLRLIPRGGIRQRIAVERIPIPRSGTGALDQRRIVAALFPFERDIARAATSVFDAK